MAESLIGLTGKGYTLIAADTAAVRSVVKFKDTEDKIYTVNNILYGITGPTGDRTNFIEYILANINLYTLRNGIELTTHAAANWTRSEIAKSLRKNPYQVSLLIGGWDKDVESSLYYSDYLGNMHKVNFGSHGYCAYFVPAILDKYWRPDMTLDEGIEVMRKCLNEIKTRCVINTPSFKIKCVDKDGIREIIIPGMELPEIL